jgi:peptidoglycan/LPS O-acetylase OafA/YrhL
MRTDPSPGFRPDVEGLRAVAVLMVLLFHTGLSWAPGGFAGVDVFFVISGFLITGHLVREAEGSGRIHLLGFYARRAKRLLPAAAVVLVATAIMAAIWTPRTRWLEIGGDIFASAFYVINWRLAARSVDYLAEDAVASPLQHFWSLAVEEQYYLVWPLLLTAGLLLLKRWLSARQVVWVMLVLIAVLSFVWSVYLTESNPAVAYFVTTTRMWELAVGGGIALLLHRWSPAPWTGVTLGWLGFGGVVASLFLQSSQTPWPGYAAALPTLGAAAVIVSGAAADPRGPAWIIARKPFQWLGGLSYSLYLWHWPLIVIGEQRYGGKLPVLYGFLNIAIAVVLAWLTQKFVENRFRYSRAVSENPRYGLSIGLNFSLVAALAGLALAFLALFSQAVPSESRPATGTSVGEARGAGILAEVPRDDQSGAPMDRVDWMTPLPVAAVADVPDVYERGCQVLEKSVKPVACVYGKVDAPITIAVVGDSKMAQWVSALAKLADRNGWRIVAYTKSSCSFSAAEVSNGGVPYHECTQWGRSVLDILTNDLRPDFVLTSHGRRDPEAELIEGFESWWGRMAAAGATVIALADNPHPRMNVYECVEQNPGRLRNCSFPRAEGSGTPSLREAARRMKVPFVDLTDAICPTERCAPVIGNVLIYRQGSHVTKTYIDTMAPRLERALMDAGVPSLP